MSQASMLLLLWDALQQRSTTFGQVLDLSSACGLDGRRVLAENLCGSQAWRYRPSRDDYRWISLEAEVLGSKQPSAIGAPRQRPTDCLTRQCCMEFFKKESAVRTVNADEKLGDSNPGKPALNIYRRSVAELLIVATMVNLVISPLPKLRSAPSHCRHASRIGQRESRGLLMAYTSIRLLSKAFRSRYSWTVSGGAK